MSEPNERDREVGRDAQERPGIRPSFIIAAYREEIEARVKVEEFERLYGKVITRISADIGGDFDLALDQLVYNAKAEARAIESIAACGHSERFTYATLSNPPVGCTACDHVKDCAHRKQLAEAQAEIERLKRIAECDGTDAGLGCQCGQEHKWIYGAPEATKLAERDRFHTADIATITAAEAEIERLKDQLELCQEATQDARFIGDSNSERAEKAEFKLAQAKREALEAAVRIAEDPTAWWFSEDGVAIHVAKAIRALMEDKPTLPLIDDHHFENPAGNDLCIYYSEDNGHYCYRTLAQHRALMKDKDK